MGRINRLYIPEKASVGRRLAEYLAATTGAKFTLNNAYALVGSDAVVWMSGHLLEQVDAHEYNPDYKTWRLEHLPIIPSPFRLRVKSDPRSNAASKVDLIRKMLADCTTVVGAGDPDAEGQLLQDELLIHLKNQKPVLRLWANALDDTTLGKALASLRPNEEFLGYYEAALSRSQADWLYGINMSRACAIHAQNAGADFKITIGRVQTPTLALVVERELQIRSFKPTDFFVPFIGLATDPHFQATWYVPKDANGSYQDSRVDPEGRLLDRVAADAIVASAKAAGQATVVHAETTLGTEAAPLPFSLSALQAHCSRLFGLSAKQTLDVAQSLYLKGLATYPRVDCDYVPESQHADAVAVLTSLAKAELPVAFGNALRGCKPETKSRAWDDKKVTAHHAIIPAHLDNPAELARLIDIELKVYLEIAKRYVLQFWPAAKVSNTQLVLACGRPGAQNLFSVRGKRYISEGWRKAFTTEVATSGEDDDEEQKAAADAASVTLPAVKKGDVLRLAEAGVHAKRTTCPKRFTDGTLITAMKNIHAYVKNPEFKKRLRESVGIGTEATRGTILEALEKSCLLLKKGKEIMPSDGAIQLITALPDQMKTPDMTAMWGQLNEEVLARRATHAQFIATLVPWLTKLVDSSASFFNPAQFPDSQCRQAAKLTEHNCFGEVEKPGCGSPLKLLKGQYGPYYGCSNDACRKVFRSVEGKPTEKTVKPTEPVDKTHKCPKCENTTVGFLRRVARKDNSGYFWGCGAWKNGCNAIFNDDDGKPDLEGKDRGGGKGPYASKSGGTGKRKNLPPGTKPGLNGTIEVRVQGL
jgi:DNA topoisomerase-3